MKNDLVLTAYEQYGVDVVNLSSHDLLYVSRLLSKAGSANASGMLTRIVSANTKSQSQGLASPKPFVVRELAASQPVRIAVVGLADPSAEVPPGFKIADPVETARLVVPRARRASDVVIVLAYGKAEGVLRLAREVPGVDLVLAGTGDVFTAPQKVGGAVVAFTPFETRMLGEVRFYREQGGGLSTKLRYISLDSGVGDDAAAAKVAADVTGADQKAYKANQKLLDDWLVSTREPSQTAPWVGSNACAQCHAAQYYQWSNSRHARSLDSLGLKRIEFDVSCLACHASGIDKGIQVSPSNVPKLASVHCEACHGPGRDHLAKPGRGYGRISNLKVLCSSCHDARTSTKFDLQAYWAKVKH